jgi:hypothetical protein
MLSGVCHTAVFITLAAGRTDHSGRGRRSAAPPHFYTGDKMPGCIDLRKHFHGSGYLIVDSENDTTNLICRRGHVYSDGQRLVAALDGGTRAECRALRKLGTVIMDGDFGELSVAFNPSVFRDVARILRPRQSRRVKSAA